MPQRRPPFSLRQQPCHALGSALPMAGTEPTPGTDSRSLTVPRSPSTKTAPSMSKREAGGLNVAPTHTWSRTISAFLFCLHPSSPYHPCPVCGLFGRHRYLHIQALQHEPGRDAISHQPKNTDTAQPSPETDKEKEWGQACPSQTAEWYWSRVRQRNEIYRSVQSRKSGIMTLWWVRYNAPPQQDVL